MVRIGLMAKRIPTPNRREVMAGLAAALMPAASRIASAQGRAQAPQTLELEAKPNLIALRPDQPTIAIWGLQGPLAPPRLKRGTLEVVFRNTLPVATTVDWRGVDGAAAAEPLTVRPPVAPGAEANFSVALRRAGTLLCDLRLLGDGQALSRPLPLIVQEDAPPAVDRDKTFLVEDWRLRGDGSAWAPGAAADDASTIYTVNGEVSPEISVRSGERLRLRFINGCQRQVIALKIEGYEVRVIAMDGAAAEPFLARNSALVMAPGGRVDALIDATAAPGTASQILLHDGKEARSLARLAISAEPPIRPTPLPPAAPLAVDGLPARLDLKGAQRVDLSLAGPEWTSPVSFSGSAPPAFKAKAGRTVVLTLGNRADRATIFHLHGHHFRLLDRLDDGWKPFWLDTLAVEPGQTQRIAFAAEFSGRWLLESISSSWAAPRLVRWYSVE
ncbi:multicopper oxidase domain-containing protein [Bradyrhizobium sp. ARR65]|uniref:multicopper oxidase family protein n=1 Tax=Bradyrhizobium sp. ARR65 TaxID=1040989 RepID=UPI000ACF10E0|nr:multicopper oxidase domain-containing protein [Bradyrhizobium sp. ARR65]